MERVIPPFASPGLGPPAPLPSRTRQTPCIGLSHILGRTRYAGLHRDGNFALNVMLDMLLLDIAVLALKQEHSILAARACV